MSALAMALLMVLFVQSIRARDYRKLWKASEAGKAVMKEKHDATIAAIDSCVTAWGFEMKIEGEKVSIGKDWTKEYEAMEWPEEIG